MERTYKWSPRPYFYLGDWYIKRTIFLRKKFLWFHIWVPVDTAFFGPFRSKFAVLQAIGNDVPKVFHR